MKKLAMFCLLVAALVASASSSMAVMTNLGQDLPLVASPNQLTPYDGRSAGRILYAPSEQDDPSFRAAIAAITGGVVDYYDTRVGTPDVALLDTYGCVMTWANYAYLDKVGFGNNLGVFVDYGGTVVLGAFVTYCFGNSLGGLIMTAAYSPVVSPSCNNHFSDSPYRGDGTSCIHVGVTAYGCIYRDYVALQGGGIQDGSYADGEIAAAYRPDYKVIFANGSGGFPVSCSGQDAMRVANAAKCDEGIIPPPVPTVETTWGSVKALNR